MRCYGAPHRMRAGMREVKVGIKTSHRVEVSEINAVRASVGLSQEKFAMLHISRKPPAL